MNVEIAPLAEEELFDAFHWYEKKRVGLGHELYDEFQDVISRIARHPYAAPIVSRGLRQTSLERFPYYILYFVESDTIVVQVIAHHRRKPLYWIVRFQ